MPDKQFKSIYKSGWVFFLKLYDNDAYRFFVREKEEEHRLWQTQRLLYQIRNSEEANKELQS